jgi:hypothetical protein|tara:strand:+ start:1053 stop:1790 length:738 start_codon:yes stop_codon:yes gene_type:complete
MYFVDSVNAQVNTEAMRAEAVSEGIINSLGVEFGFEKSDQEVLDVAAKYRIDYFNPGGLHVFFVLNYENGYEKEHGETKNQIVNKGFGHIRLTKDISSNLFFEVFTQFGYNDFLSMKDRRLAGSGLRYRMLEGDKMDAFIGIGAMQENEIYDLQSEAAKRLIRSTNYIRWNITISENARLNNTAYYQLASSDMADYRLLYDGGLEFEIGEKLYFTVELNYRYDNDPHGNLGKSYVEINNGIEFNF